MALAFDMNVLDGSSLGYRFAIFDLAWEGCTFSFFHFCHYLHHIHDYAMKGVAFNVNDLLFWFVKAPYMLEHAIANCFFMQFQSPKLFTRTEVHSPTMT